MQHPLMMREVASNTNRSFVALLALSVLLAIAGQSETRLFGFLLLSSSSLHPNEYPNGAEVPIWNLPLTSVDTQLTLAYDESLFCPSAAAADSTTSATPPSKWILDTTNPTLPSSIKVRNDDETTTTGHTRTQLCQKTLDQEQAQALQKLIESGYHFNLAIDDGLPGACTVGMHRYYHGGCPIGFITAANSTTNGQRLHYYIFNHWKLQVLVNSKNQVVGFNIQPESQEDTEKEEQVGTSSKVYSQLVAPNETISFTYQVEIISISKMELEWSQRWRIYLGQDNHVPYQVHYRSILDGLMVLIFLGVLLNYQWTKQQQVAVDAKLAEPLLPYTTTTTEDHDELLSEPIIFHPQNWRKLDGDVFRPPSSPMLLCVACGTGAQILSTALMCCIMCFLGIQSLVYKRTLFVGFLVSYSLLGSWVGGYVTAKTYQTLQMSHGKQRAIYYTTLSFPLLVSVAFFGFRGWSIINGAISRPLYPDVLLVVLAMVVFLSQSLRGAHYGFAQHDVCSTPPFPVAPVAREIPEGSWWYRCGFPAILSLLFGYLLCSMSLGDSNFLLVYFWYGRYFDTLGYLLVVLVIMVLCSAAFGVESTFIRLNQENHQWWWPSFMGGASSGFFFLVYYWSRAGAMNVGQTVGAAVYYYVVTLIASLGLGLSFGFVSFACSLYFVQRIYAKA